MNGFFGSGGGIILVVLLGAFINLEERKVFATTLCVTLFLSCISAFIYSRSVDITLAEIMPFLIGGSLGGIIGGLWLKNIKISIVQKAFALLVLFIGIKGVFKL